MILNKNLFKKHILWYNYKDIKVLVLKDINTFCYEFSFLYIKLEVYLKWGEIVAKKKSKKKKAKESNFTAEYNNLITIFIGIFLLYKCIELHVLTCEAFFIHAYFNKKYT